jgi:hypothetical protein
MRLSRAELRQRFRGLRDLVNTWDPIGVFADPDWPRDEYASVVGPLLRQLEANAPRADIAEYLYREFTGHFGLVLSRRHTDEWALQALQYYSSQWPGSEAIPAE